MKILLVSEGSLERAGVCLFMYQWARAIKTELPDSMVTIYFRLHTKDLPLRKEFEKNGIKIITGNHSEDGTTANKTNRDGIRRDLRRILRSHYDIVHIHSSVIGFTSVVLSEAQKAKVPVRISHSHGKFEESPVKKTLHDLLRIYIRREAYLYAGCSVQAGIYMFGEKGICSEKWHRVPNTIETERFTFNKTKRIALRNEIGLRDDEILLGAVGYLEEVKNHSFLVDVMAGLKQKDIHAKMIILGDGSLKEDLTLKIRDCKLRDDIILYGRTDDIPGWLSAMDCFLMPSLSEGLPLSAVEAQASGLPCLLSDCISEEVDILSSVYHLPIDQGADVWAEKIIDMEPCNRACSELGLKNESERFLAANKVLLAGFDSSSLVHEIREMYNLNARDIAEK